MIHVYVTPEQMIEKFGDEELIEVTNLRDRSATEINWNRLMSACEQATGILNGYLMLRYEIPLVNISDSLAQTLSAHAANIARHALDATGDDVQRKFEAAMRWVEQFSAQSNGMGSGDTTPGIDIEERFGSVAYGNLRAPFWTEESTGRLF